jgi:hypothetical protein
LFREAIAQGVNLPELFLRQAQDDRNLNATVIDRRYKVKLSRKCHGFGAESFCIGAGAP